MAEYIVMPKLGFDMREGVLVSWLKDVGQDVEKGDIVAEIESDKATLELESQVNGTLLKFLADEGDVVPIGGNLAIVGDSSEDVSDMVEQATEIDSTDQLEETTEAKETDEAVEARKEEDIPATGDFPGGYKASPVARRVAEEKGIDLSRVEGTGPGGRIRKADVEKYAETERPVTRETLPEPVGVPSLKSEEVTTSRLRQAIGRRMTESKTSIPHFYVTTEIDMAAWS